MKVKVITAILGASLSLLAISSHASHTVYYGEDLGLGEATRLLTHPNADAARALFFANLGGVAVGTENFDTIANGTGAPLPINFPGFGTATLEGNGYVSYVPSGTNGVGRYPVSGNNYWESSGVFSIEFSKPVAAFGFYGIDIGDFNGQVKVTLSNGVDEVYNIPNTINAMGGGVLYWGIIDNQHTYTKLTFGNTGSGVDQFGFDDFTVGGVVPVPASLPLLLSGLVGLAALLRRKN